MSQQQANRPAGEVLVEMRNMVKVFGPWWHWAAWILPCGAGRFWG